MPAVASIAGTYGFGRPRRAAGGAGPSGSLKVNVIGDSNVGSAVTGLNNARTAMGYTGVTVTYTQTSINNYTGSDLTTANYDVILVWMNGGLTINSNLGTNINTYISNGGKAVFGVFLWNISITNLTYTNTPYVFRAAQNTETATMTVTVTHPITTNVPTTIAVGSTFNHPTISVQATATSIATFPSGNSMVAYQESPRRVGINLFGGYIGSFPNIARLYLNAILWAGGLLN